MPSARVGTGWRRRSCWIAIISLSLASSGCWPASQNEVVVYSALDRDFSQPIFDRFTAETGIVVRAKYDVESTKTVGLTNALLAEGDPPRCDLFWNNEILNTLRLRRHGRLDTYHPPAAEDYPPAYRSADGSWHGFAARARILLVNTDLVPSEERPQSILELAEPQWQQQVGMAKPLFGTTATHAAVLFAVWGEDRARHFFRQVHNNTQILSGNKQVALAVGRGQIAWGLTDTDDAVIELEQGRPVTIIYPDQSPEQMGTLFIPNSLSLLNNSPHPANARRLVDYLLSPEIETLLAQGRSAQIPLGRQVTVQPRVATPKTIRALEVDFEAAADQWDNAAQWLREEFGQ